MSLLLQTAVPDSLRNRPRVALVGISGYARRHLELLRAFASQLELVAAVVIEKDQQLEDAGILRQAGVRIHPDFAGMIAAEAGHIDLCVIPTGIQWHARMTIAALEAGANVLVEKPLAGCLADALAIQACEKRTGRWVAVGFQDIYSAGAMGLKTQLCNGRIGRLKSIRFLGLNARNDEYYARNHWAGSLEKDGATTNDSPLNNAFAHLANLALFFGGDSFARSAEVTVESADLWRARKIESFDTAVVRAKSKSGIDFWFGVSHACAGSPSPLLEIKGEHGMAEWHRGSCYRLNVDGETPTEVALASDDEVCRAMYTAILQRLEGGSPFICDTAIALEHTRLINGVHSGHRIHSLDPAFLERVPAATAGGSSGLAIRGIHDFMAAAFASGSSKAVAAS